MARYYAEIQGNRGEASRMGTTQSGIHGHIRGWGLGVEVHGGPIYGDDECDRFAVYITKGSGGIGSHLVIGSVAETENGISFNPTDDLKARVYEESSIEELEKALAEKKRMAAAASV